MKNDEQLRAYRSVDFAPLVCFLPEISGADAFWSMINQGAFIFGVGENPQAITTNLREMLQNRFGIQFDNSGLVDGYWNLRTNGGSIYNSS